MSKPITASFRWSKDEFLRAQRLAVHYSRQGRWLYRFTTFMGVMILLGGLVGLFQRTTGWLGFLYTALFSSFFFSMPLFARRAAVKQYAQKPDRDMEVTWNISEEGIHTRTQLASSENTWAFFQKVLRVRDGFLFYPSARVFHWLPLHAFRDPGDAERVAELAKLKVKDYGHVAK